MIRETHQAPENARKSSFPITRGLKREEFRPYAKESLLVDRGNDSDQLFEDDTEPTPISTDVEDDLDGMQTIEGEFDDPAVAIDDDDDDDEVDIDTRPEDEY